MGLPCGPVAASAKAIPLELNAELQSVDAPHHAEVTVARRIGRLTHASWATETAAGEIPVSPLEVPPWRMDRGVAVDGPLQGQALRPEPYIPAFSRAWRDFYQHSRWYGED